MSQKCFTNPSLSDIEEHFKKQDRVIKQGSWLTSASFGGAVALVGISIGAQKYFGLAAEIVSWFLIGIGIGYMFWCKYKQSKI